MRGGAGLLAEAAAKDAEQFAEGERRKAEAARLAATTAATVATLPLGGVTPGDEGDQIARRSYGKKPNRHSKRRGKK